MGAAAYPLAWPLLRPRTPAGKRRNATFLVSLGAARDQLLDELRRLDGLNVVISSNMPVRRDGVLYADALEPADPGVAAYFTRANRPFVIACDAYRKARWNVRAIGATAEALRTIKRHGATEMLEQAMSGFVALPPAPAEDPWWIVLGCGPGDSLGSVRDAFLLRVREHHPDAGGETSRMVRVNRAYEQAKEYLARVVAP